MKVIFRNLQPGFQPSDHTFGQEGGVSIISWLKEGDLEAGSIRVWKPKEVGFLHTENLPHFPYLYLGL